MFRIYLQKFSGSIKGSNFLSQELVDRCCNKDEAHDVIDKAVKKAEKDGYIGSDGAYFEKDHSKSYAFCIIPEDEAPLESTFKKGVYLNAR